MDLEKFNPQQRNVIRSRANKMLVIASAASGKTATMIAKIQYLLEKGVSPEKILVFAFTNLAAEEVAKRMENVKDIDKMYIGTIHSWAVDLCADNGIQVFDLISTEQFDDIIKRALMVNLAKFPEVEWVFIDEAQDLSAAEFELMRRMNTRHICYIGDPKQEIYMFRNGVRNNLEDMYEDASFKKYQLNTNYRNPEEIVEFANQYVDVVQARICKPTLKCANKEKGYIWDDLTFEECLDDIKPEEYKNWAILTRSNEQLKNAQSFLEYLEIPYVSFNRADLTFEELKEATNTNAVKVLTCHAMKGSEIDYVIAVGFGKFNREERNISYVAATRAKKELYWIPKLNLPPKVKKFKEKQIEEMEESGDIIEYGGDIIAF